MPDPALSVCICTFNGADRIGLVLAALGRQTDATNRWDVLVVDNASRDGTSDTAAREIATHLPNRGRVVREEQAGLMHARRKATTEARGAVIAFLDDDNIAEEDYIARLLDLLPNHPRMGVVGGKVVAEWIGDPTPLGVAIANFALAICDRGDAPFAYTDVTGGPAGAGMVVKRDLMQKIFEESALAQQVTGRDASGVGGGEDTAIVIRAHQLGYEVLYEPSLRIRHRIPASRTAPEYLARLYEGIGRGQASMRRLFDPKMRNPALALLIALKEGARWAVGCLAGPSPALSKEFGPLAADVHRLQLRQTYGRFKQGLKESFR